MLISFIITYHNEPLSMLRQCVESVILLSLDKNEREIIIVDDGSEKSPIEGLGELASEVEYIRQENQGLSVARNTGIDAAKGEYIQFVDGDDYLLAKPYNQILQSIKENNADVLMFRFTSDDSIKQNDKISLSKCWKGDEFLCKNNLRASACAYVFKRELLGGLRFRQGIYHEDILFTPSLLIKDQGSNGSNSSSGSSSKVQRLFVTKLQAYYYRQHEGTITSRREYIHLKKRLDDNFLVLKELRKLRDDSKDVAHVAFDRCLNQQVMGYVYWIYKLVKDKQERKLRISALKDFGLYPLPLKFYTLKYFLFALIRS